MKTFFNTHMVVKVVKYFEKIAKSTKIAMLGEAI